MGQEHPHTNEIIMVSNLLSKICVTLQGSLMGGSRIFLCNTLNLDEYLYLGDDFDMPEPGPDT